MTQATDHLLSPMPVSAEVGRAVAAAHRLNEVLLRATYAHASGLGEVAEHLETLADQLEESAPTAHDVVQGIPWQAPFTRHDAVSGSANPIAPPVEVYGQSPGEVWGRMRLGLLHQGPPGLVHGGMIAMVLDHVLALANSWSGTMGMTGSLQLTYRRPTPLFVDLEVHAVQESIIGRRITTTGSILHEGVVCATATGVFVTVPERG